MHYSIDNNKHTNTMIALGIILMFIGGGIFAIGEGKSCLFMLIGAAINFTGIGMLMSAF